MPSWLRQLFSGLPSQPGQPNPNDIGNKVRARACGHTTEPGQNMPLLQVAYYTQALTYLPPEASKHLRCVVPWSERGLNGQAMPACPSSSSNRQTLNTLQRRQSVPPQIWPSRRMPMVVSGRPYEGPLCIWHCSQQLLKIPADAWQYGYVVLQMAKYQSKWAGQGHNLQREQRGVKSKTQATRVTARTCSGTQCGSFFPESTNKPAYIIEHCVR